MNRGRHVIDYRKDPVAFMKDILGVHMSEFQVEFMKHASDKCSVFRSKETGQLTKKLENVIWS